ncbi:hypothetical protein AB0P45_36665, partial [Streptomyces niveus]
GDLLVYPNTAGYQMDSNESPFHDLAIPPKVVRGELPDRRYRRVQGLGHPHRQVARIRDRDVRDSGEELRISGSALR